MVTLSAALQLDKFPLPTLIEVVLTLWSGELEEAIHRRAGVFHP